MSSDAFFSYKYFQSIVTNKSIWPVKVMDWCHFSPHRASRSRFFWDVWNYIYVPQIHLKQYLKIVAQLLKCLLMQLITTLFRKYNYLVSTYEQSTFLITDIDTFNKSTSFTDICRCDLAIISDSYWNIFGCIFFTSWALALNSYAILLRHLQLDSLHTHPKMHSLQSLTLLYALAEDWFFMRTLSRLIFKSLNILGNIFRCNFLAIFFQTHFKCIHPYNQNFRCICCRHVITCISDTCLDVFLKDTSLDAIIEERF
jgi:hypothetical protein